MKGRGFFSDIDTHMMTRLLFTLLCCCLLVAPTFASEGGGEGGGEGGAAKPAGIGYYSMDPEFVTNYQTQGPTLGYVRVKVELMVDNAADIAILKNHDPLLRDAINTILGNQTKDQVRTTSGREEMRKVCKKEVEKLLYRETGREVIRDLIFTTYLYQ